MDVTSSMVMLLAAYLLGSFPAGFLMGKARGVDIRQSGSGNIGATNAFRVLGKPAGTVVLLVDALKGWLAVAVLTRLVFRGFGMDPEQSVEEYYRLLAGFAAVLGHNFTCWLRFKGGKGIATSAGMLLALVPWALLIIFCVFVLVFLLTRYVSLASIGASVALPVSTVCLGRSPVLIGVTTAMALLAIFMHRSNIQRLIKGTESRMRFREKKAGE